MTTETWQLIKDKLKPDGPSLESSSYLNVTLRYLGPWNPWTLGSCPTSTTSSAHTSSYLLLSLPPTSSYLLLHSPTSFYLFLPPSISSYLLLSPTSSYMVWFGMVWYGEVELWHWDWRWTFDINIDVRKFMGGLVGGGCIWIKASALVLFLSFTFELDILDLSGPELDNNLWKQLRKIHSVNN